MRFASDKPATTFARCAHCKNWRGGCRRVGRNWYCEECDAGICRLMAALLEESAGEDS